MQEKAKTIQVSKDTITKIYRTIKAELNQPVGILVYGIDSKMKSEVVDEILMSFKGTVNWNDWRHATPGLMQERLAKGEPMLLVLDGDESLDAIVREKAAQDLLQAGAQGIAHIYVMLNSIPISPLTSVGKHVQFNSLLDKIALENAKTSNPDSLKFIVGPRQECL